MMATLWYEGPPPVAGRRVCLVGNGPSLTQGRPLGAEIDGHEVVVRINRYALRGVEAHVGRRTDLWVTFGRGQRPQDEEEMPAAALYIHGVGPAPLGLTVAAAYGIPRPFFERAQAALTARRTTAPGERELLPSSGLLAAWWLLRCGVARPLSLAGFDHFSRNRGGRHHYWDPRVYSAPREHDGEAEASLMAEMERAGLAKKLKG
jgi:hypothetical protein